MKISLIAAYDNNYLLGSGGKIPWDIPNDLKRVKEVTWGKSIVMGRKTFESIGKPLPGRQNIVMTNNKLYTAKGIDVVHSISEALSVAENEELVVFGGEGIYKMFLPYVDEMHITRIHGTFEGDVYFPEFKWDSFERVHKESWPADSKNKYAYDFLVYRRLEESSEIPKEV